MELKYKVVYFDSNACTSTDHETGYTALVEAKALSPVYGRCKVVERHGSRWYTIATAENGNLTATGKRKDYYILPTDRYGQPTGMVNTVCLHKAEAMILQRTHGYVFDSYVAACYRADA